MAVSKSRIMKDMTRLLTEIKTNPESRFEIDPNNETDLENPVAISSNGFTVLLKGPHESVYSGGKFKISIRPTSEYPFKPPVVKFLTKIYHPNISNNHAERTNICLDILKDKWTPSQGFISVILSLSALLSCPEPNDPLVGEAASLYLKDKKSYIKKAVEFTKNHAIEDETEKYLDVE